MKHGEIDSIIHSAYLNIPPATQAAIKLFNAGITEDDFREHKKHTLMDDVKFMSVQNELRDLWKGIKI